MIRRFVIICIVFIFVLVLAGCTSQEPPNFVGSINSDIYHYTDCEWARRISTENLVEFSSIEETREKGYRPCFVCAPPR